MDFRRALLAAVLSLGVLFAWQTIFPPQERVHPAVEETPVAPPTSEEDGFGEADYESALGDSELAGLDESPAISTGETVADGDAPATGDGAASEPREVAAEVVGTAEVEHTLESREFRATFTNRGAELSSLELWNHREANGDLVELVQGRAEGAVYPLGLVDAETGSAHPLHDALYVVTEATDEVGETVLVYEYRGPLGVSRKRFGLSESGGLRVEIEGAGDWAVRMGPSVRAVPDGVDAESRIQQRSVVWRQDGDVDRDNIRGLKEVSRLGAGGLDWVGVNDNYFLAAVLPQDGVREVVVYPLVDDGSGMRRVASGEKPDKGARREVDLVVVPEASRVRALVYMGTKEFDRLAEMPRELTGAAAQTGFLGALARPLEVALRWIYANIVQNYGWAIVILTLGIKIVLFPLTQKSMVSMARMQELNPKIQSIRTKYRPKLKDKQGRPNAEAQRKMNEEIMTLYKQEGVNPAGGCLPMLVQLPIFFALFRLLGSAIELRNAPWIFWIQDLSVPDPFFALPILMGASQLLQQKLTPMSGDPMQKRLMTFMPIMFVVFAFGFPAGLVLYWLTSNLLTIVQNSLYNRWKESRKAAA